MTEPTSEHICFSCRFSEDETDAGGDFLECHRRSPSPETGGKGKAAMWPLVAPTNWSGDWRPGLNYNSQAGPFKP